MPRRLKYDVDSKPKKKFRSELSEIVRWMCRETSSHGSNWFLSIDSPWIKYPFLLLLGCLQAALFFIFVRNTLYGEPAIITSTKFVPMSRALAPNVTVCSARMFNKARAEAANISDDLATYMGLLANPTHLFRTPKDIYTAFVAEQTKVFERRFNGYTRDEIQDIYQNISIRCEEFIVSCHNYDDIYYSGEECCKRLMNPKPLLFPYGACFYTAFNKDSYETLEVTTGSLDGFHFVLKADPEDMVKPNRKFSGVLGSHIGGTFALFGKEAPIAALSSRAMHLKLGSGTDVGVQLEKYIRRDFRNRWYDYGGDVDQVGESCVIDTDDIYKIAMDFGFGTWSKFNCNMMFLSSIVPQKQNCSLASAWGFSTAQNAIAEENPIYDDFPELARALSRKEPCHAVDVAFALTDFYHTDRAIDGAQSEKLSLITLFVCTMTKLLFILRILRPGM